MIAFRGRGKAKNTKRRNQTFKISCETRPLLNLIEIRAILRKRSNVKRLCLHKLL